MDLLHISKAGGGLQVEPFNRSLVDTEADVMINGRRQDHGFERAHIQVDISSGITEACDALWASEPASPYRRVLSGSSKSRVCMKHRSIAGL